MTKSDTKAPNTHERLHDEHPTYLKTLSILAGIKEVRDDLSTEARELLEKNSRRCAGNSVMFPAGYGERTALLEALDDGYKAMITDMRRAARSSGLSFPEDLT